MPFLIISGLLCATPQIINNTPYQWNNDDQFNYLTAVRRCGEKYEKSPCLKYFTKIGERDYNAICAGALVPRK